MAKGKKTNQSRQPAKNNQNNQKTNQSSNPTNLTETQALENNTQVAGNSNPGTSNNNSNPNQQSNLIAENPKKRMRPDLEELLSDEEEEEEEDLDENAIIQEMTELNEKLDDENAIEDKPLIIAIFRFVFNYLPKILETLRSHKALNQEVGLLKKTITNQEEQLKSQEKEIKNLRKEILNNQIAQSSRSILIKSLEPEQTNENESQLRDTLTKVFDEMGVTNEIQIRDAYRMKSKKPLPPTAVHPPVKLTFLNKYQKTIFMKNLKNLNTYKHIKVTMDCPKLLLTDYRAKDKAAYNLRKSQEGTKTLLTIKNQTITIMVMGPNQSTYTEWKCPTPTPINEPNLDMS